MTADSGVVQQIQRIFAKLGVPRDGTIYVHADLQKFGLHKGRSGRFELFLSPESLYEGLRAHLGSQGTIVVPTFTGGGLWGKGLPFSVRESPGTTGIFAEFLRRRPEARRSEHPILSHAAEGPLAERITKDRAIYGFGIGSVYEALLEADAIFLMAGVPYCSIKDHVEVMQALPYRYKKRFRGVTEIPNGDRKTTFAYHHVRYMNPEVAGKDFIAGLEPAQRQSIRWADFGKFKLGAIAAVEAARLVAERVSHDPYAFVSLPSDEHRQMIEWIAWLQSDQACSLVAENEEGREMWIWELPASLAAAVGRPTLKVGGPDACFSALRAIACDGFPRNPESATAFFSRLLNA